MHCYPKKRRAKVTLSAQPYHSLESRQMLAGNVLVNYDAVTKNLLLTGDNLNNQVSVVQGPANGLVTITGNNGTTINGSAQMVLPGPYLGNVSSQMGQGNDALTFTNVVLQNYNAQENGNGADRLTMNNVKVKGNVLVNTLGGNDQLKISGDFSGNVSLETDAGNDTVVVSGRVGVVMNALGTIDPEYQFGSQNASGNGRTLRVSTSQGLDAIKLTDLDIDGLAVILSGDADDVVNTIRTRAHDRINVRTGTGNDQVTVESTATPTMNLNLEDGSDTFTQVTGGALPALRRLDGGAGPDTAVLNGGPVGVIVNVETIVP